MECVNDSEKLNVYKGEFHYMIHHGVVHQESETTKLRIVYNGSAKAVGDDYPLKDCLLTVFQSYLTFLSSSDGIRLLLLQTLRRLF